MHEHLEVLVPCRFYDLRAVKIQACSFSIADFWKLGANISATAAIRFMILSLDMNGK